MADKVKEWKPDCTTCRFSEERHAPPSIQRIRICRRFPPVPVTIQTPEGIGQASVFPLVEAESWCHEWTPHESRVVLDG